mmetsp:Transcript_13617/g.21516  ORF Transcript_13617/g.21516 Transcript_13617/m.21516 type:complete len:155 (-) Transcript_13617:7-471(-)
MDFPNSTLFQDHKITGPGILNKRDHGLRFQLFMSGNLVLQYGRQTYNYSGVQTAGFKITMPESKFENLSGEFKAIVEAIAKGVWHYEPYPQNVLTITGNNGVCLHICMYACMNNTPVHRFVCVYCMWLRAKCEKMRFLLDMKYTCYYIYMCMCR